MSALADNQQIWSDENIRSLNLSLTERWNLRILHQPFYYIEIDTLIGIIQ